MAFILPPKKRLRKKVSRMSSRCGQSDLGRATSPATIEEPAAQPRAQAAHRFAFRDDALHHRIGVLHLDPIGTPSDSR